DEVAEVAADLALGQARPDVAVGPVDVRRGPAGDQGQQLLLHLGRRGAAPDRLDLDGRVLRLVLVEERVVAVLGRLAALGQEDDLATRRSAGRGGRGRGRRRGGGWLGRRGRRGGGRGAGGWRRRGRGGWRGRGCPLGG